MEVELRRSASESVIFLLLSFNYSSGQVNSEIWHYVGHMVTKLDQGFLFEQLKDH